MTASQSPSTDKRLAALAESTLAAPALANPKPAESVLPESELPDGARPLVKRKTNDLGRAMQLIEVVAETRDQPSAVVALVNRIAELFPNASVRCGLGARRMRRFYDSRLGWLGSTSDLFKNADRHWNDDGKKVPTGKSNAGESASDAAPVVRLNIDDQVGLGRCVLWIDGIEIETKDRIWLRKTLPGLRSLIWQRTGGVLSHLARNLSNSGMTTRIYLGLACLVVLLFSIWPVSYRVRCSAVVRPLQSRVVAVPFAATLAEAVVEPGNTVKVGDVMLLLDGRPLRLELEAIDAQIAQISKQRDVASFSGAVADAQQAKFKALELSRRRDLLVERLSKLRVTAPIDGVVVAGDLKRSIGTPMEVGQAVFEVAPLEKMVVELEIPEYEIGYVNARNPTRIRLTASNRGAIDEELDQLYPASEIRDGQNVFVARVDLENADGDLRPGMRGSAIVYGPLRPWLWSLVRGGWEKVLWWVGY